jgi:hypothetical protein
VVAYSYTNRMLLKDCQWLLLCGAGLLRRFDPLISTDRSRVVGEGEGGGGLEREKEIIKKIRVRRAR